MFGQVVVHDERIHAVLHEILTHRRSGVRRDVLIGGIVGSGRRNDDCVFQRTVIFENFQGARKGGIFLPDADVNRINGTEIRIVLRQPLSIEFGLVQNRIQRESGLARGTVADD